MGDETFSRGVMCGACDSHIHIFDNGFSTQHTASSMQVIPPTLESYRQVQGRLGTQRVVVVTPRIYDTDNSVTVDAISKFGKENARGIAVLRPDVTDSQLESLHEAGIRGARFTLHNVNRAPTTIDMAHSLAHRVRPFGWHIQVHLSANQIAEYEEILMDLPTPIVFDHFGRLPVLDGLNHPARRIIEHLLRDGRGWIKLSAPYLESHLGKRGDFADVDQIAKHWIQVAPHAVVWGSDWPHTMASDKPDTPHLLSRLSSWTNDAETSYQILVTNPARLYGFQVTSNR